MPVFNLPCPECGANNYIQKDITYDVKDKTTKITTLVCRNNNCMMTYYGYKDFNSGRISIFKDWIP
jgi:predicted nucleic-acid-binding Zn-ribbon protein